MNNSKKIRMIFLSKIPCLYLPIIKNKYKNPKHTGLVISHWMSTKYTIEFIGLWEKMHNPKLLQNIS